VPMTVPVEAPRGEAPARPRPHSPPPHSPPPPPVVEEVLVSATPPAPPAPEVLPEPDVEPKRRTETDFAAGIDAEAGAAPAEAPAAPEPAKKPRGRAPKQPSTRTRRGTANEKPTKAPPAEGDSAG
jgi:hypothetical protein